MKWKTCYICYIVYAKAFTVLHFMLHGVTLCYVNGNVFTTEGTCPITESTEVFGEDAENSGRDARAPLYQYVKEQKP